MAINPGIPLQVQNFDISQGVNAFANAYQQTKNNERQAAQDAEVTKSRDLQNQASELQIQQAKNAIEQQGKTQAVKDWALDLTKIKPLIDAGDLQNARQLLIQRKAKLVELQGNDPTVNTNDTDNLIKMIDSKDLNSLNNVINSELTGLQKLGFIQPDAKGKTGLASAVSELLPGGGSRKILPDGNEEVRNAFNQVVTGQEALDVINRSDKIVADREKAKQDLRVQTERELEQVKSAEKKATEAFGMVDKIRQNITNLEQVIPLVGKGANTGPIVSSLPSFKAATIELENLQKRLGLDVVGAVTFGALSKGELDLAQAVALPLNLTGDDLINWVNDSINAKRKLASYFEDQAIFLSNGGTNAGWYLHLKEQQAAKDAGNQQQGNQPQIAEGATATNPQTGEKIIFRGGQWQAQ